MKCGIHEGTLHNLALFAMEYLSSDDTQLSRNKNFLKTCIFPRAPTSIDTSNVMENSK